MCENFFPFNKQIVTSTFSNECKFKKLLICLGFKINKYNYQCDLFKYVNLYYRKKSLIDKFKHDYVYVSQNVYPVQGKLVEKVDSRQKNKTRQIFYKLNRYKYK